MRKIYKIESDEELYVIWCDTVDMLMPNMFDSRESANLWLEKVYTDKEVFKRFKEFQGIVSVKSIEEMLSFN